MRIMPVVKNEIKRIYHYGVKGMPKGYIFMLHRVDYKDDKKLIANENMKVSPNFLDNFLRMNHKKYDFVSLKEVPERLKQKSDKKFIAFTMDDGYKDNYTNALPIFMKYEIPFTIFVASDFPDKKAVLWWYVLEDYLLENSFVRLNNGFQKSIKTKREKEDTFFLIRNMILSLNQKKLLEELNDLFLDRLPWIDKTDKLTMDWEDVRKCYLKELVDIGGHTRHHYNLRKLESSLEIKKEIVTGCKILKEKAGVITDCFAYPFGSWNEVDERSMRIASKMNFKLACIAEGGFCGSKSRNLYALPRIMFTEQLNGENLL